jgi:hypothetical protein
MPGGHGQTGRSRNIVGRQNLPCMVRVSWELGRNATNCGIMVRVCLMLWVWVASLCEGS